ERVDMPRSRRQQLRARSRHREVLPRRHREVAGRNLRQESNKTSAERDEASSGRDPYEVARPCRPSVGLTHAEVRTRECSDHLAGSEEIVRVSRLRKLQQGMTGRPAGHDPHHKSKDEEWIVIEETREKGD